MLQPGNYFGLSASTGEMPDHHQLFGFSVTPLEATANADANALPVANQENPVSKDKTTVHSPRRPL